MSVDLVIFDLDGTLVDSEGISKRVISEITSRYLARPMSVDEASQFHGQTISYVLDELERLHGMPLPGDFLTCLVDTYHSLCETELSATVNVEEAIKRLLPTPLCVASNGTSSTIEMNLRTCGLSPYFGENYFSAEQVRSPKPSPDLFLLAAECMSASPARSVVIEDSVIGITAGLAAGMHVTGFAGNHPETSDSLAATGVRVLTDMADLPALVAAL